MVQFKNTDENILPQRKSNLVHFSLKIRQLVASNLLIFLRINLPQCMHLLKG